MHCEPIRHALSALLDGEDPEVERTDIDSHLETCAGCRAWADEVSTLHRMVRVRAADAVPDLTDRILAAAPATLATS